MISSYYYARTLDFSNAKIGDIFEFDSFLDEEVWKLKQLINFFESENKLLVAELEKSKAQEKEPSKSWGFSIFGCELSLTIWKD
jgi:hypothetical protein